MPAPAPYIRYLLMREFGWTPEVVHAIQLPELLEILTCMQADAQYQNRPKGRKVEKPSTA